MNIEELKKQADKRAKGKEEIGELRAKVISRYEDLIDIQKNYTKILNKHNRDYKQKLVNEVVNYFDENNFEIQKDSVEILARYKDLEVKIQVNENEDGYLDVWVMFKYYSICNTMKVEPTAEDKMSMQIGFCNIKINDQLIYGGNYKDEINKCNNYDELCEAEKNINKNIEQLNYNKTQIDSLEYKYYNESTPKEYQSFKEFFEELLSSIQ